MKDSCHIILFVLTCFYGCLLLPFDAQCQQDSYKESRKEQDRIRSLHIRSSISLSYGSRDNDSLFCSMYEIVLYNTHGDLVYAEDAICCGPHFIRDVFNRRDKLIRNMDSTGNFSKAFLLLQEKRHRSQKAKRDYDLDDAHFCYVHFSYEQDGKKILKTTFEPKTEFPWEREETTFDSSGKLLSNLLFIGGRSNDIVLAQEFYCYYDNAGRKTLQYQPSVDSIVFVYDDKARLSQILRYRPNAGLGAAQVYNYSDTGYTVRFKENRTPLNDTGTTAETYRIDQLTDRGYERYDTGNRIQESNLLNYETYTVYKYDDCGFMTSQTTNGKTHTDYEYDAQHRRSAKLGCGETTCTKWVYQYNEQGEMTSEKEYVNNEAAGKRVHVYTHFR
ncbi:MAG: hypothetical protein V4590_03095 [Bacteroidota bacterium]